MPSPLAVAVTVSSSAVSLAATVRRPVAEMVVPALLLPDTDQVTSSRKLPVPSTLAVNCCVLPASTVAAAGSTVTPVMVAGCVTVTVAVPDVMPSPLAVALTVRVSAVSPVATVRTPSSEMVVPALLPDTDQVTSLLTPPVPLTVAVNLSVSPASTSAVFGSTVTPVMVAGGVTVTVAVADLPLLPTAVALTVRVVAVSSVAMFRTPLLEINVPVLSLPDTVQTTLLL